MTGNSDINFIEAMLRDLEKQPPGTSYDAGLKSAFAAGKADSNNRNYTGPPGHTGQEVYNMLREAVLANDPVAYKTARDLDPAGRVTDSLNKDFLIEREPEGTFLTSLKLERRYREQKL